MFRLRFIILNSIASEIIVTVDEGTPILDSPDIPQSMPSPQRDDKCILSTFPLYLANTCKTAHLRPQAKKALMFVRRPSARTPSLAHDLISENVDDSPSSDWRKARRSQLHD